MMQRSVAPEEVAGLCFRCLETGHRVRACTNPVRCRRCLISGHESSCCETLLPGDHRAQPPAVHCPVPDTPPRNPPPQLPRDAPLPRNTAPSPPPASAPARVTIARSIEMEEAEEVLARGMVATITGTSPSLRYMRGASSR